MPRKPGSLNDELGPSLAQTVGFGLLGRELAKDVRAALQVAMDGGAIFPGTATPLSVYRQTLATAIGNIHGDGRAPLFLRFLKDGPYEGDGDIPRELKDHRLTDGETASVIAFVYGHMINCFKGALTEMLSAAPCLHILRELQREGSLPGEAILYVGDAVQVPRSQKGGYAKGADHHLLAEYCGATNHPSVLLGGVVEVKSYFCPPQSLRRQLNRHVERAHGGLRICGREYTPSQIKLGGGGKRKPVQVSVLPARWTLPRTFHYRQEKKVQLLEVDPGIPPSPSDRIEQLTDSEWRITLRWSKEAIAAAAYEMTFWFMGEVGEVLYTDAVPTEWSEMTPAQAGRNAAKAMLYYAILRCHTARQAQRAIALYNSYCFGYSLGMHFRDPEGRREMLWPQDLDEIAATGQTKHGCRIR